MAEFEQWFAMGGYGGYVWPSYALAAAIMIGFALYSFRSLRAARRALERQEARHGGRRRDRPTS